MSNVDPLLAGEIIRQFRAVLMDLSDRNGAVRQSAVHPETKAFARGYDRALADIGDRFATKIEIAIAQSGK